MTALKEHMAMIVTTTSHLEARLQTINHKLCALLDRATISATDQLQRSRLEEEQESTERCLRICVEASKNVIRKMQELNISSSSQDATPIKSQQGWKDSSEKTSIDGQSSKLAGEIRINVFEDIVAASGSLQVIAAASGDLITAARVTAQIRSRQWMGQFSDATLEVLLQQRREDDRTTGQRKDSE